MKPSSAAMACLWMLAGGLWAGERAAATGEPAAATPAKPVTLTFYVAGMECSACTEFVNQAVRQVKSVTDVCPDELGVLNISFDPKVASAQQIAQAVAEALPLHGKPYEATLRIRVPGCAPGGDLAGIEAAFAKDKAWVNLELLNKEKGEFAIHFLPLQWDSAKAGPQGWSPGWGEAAGKPSPVKSAVPFTLVTQGQSDGPAR